MNFARFEPTGGAAKVIECYWTVEGEGPSEKQKIIPDGFPEIIFHFGDPYRICLEEEWKSQDRSLFAGQISRHFWLENAGKSDMIGIKMKPTAATHLFGIKMKPFTDAVTPFGEMKEAALHELDQHVRTVETHHERLDVLNNFFSRGVDVKDNIVDRAVHMIFAQRGMITVADIARRLDVTERHIEQKFNNYVGLSPKFYARVIRFSNIFQSVKENKPDWGDLVFNTGFYDQSHFIRNFKAFAGEDPSAYMFGERTLANFFLKKR